MHFRSIFLIAVVLSSISYPLASEHHIRLDSLSYDEVADQISVFWTADTTVSNADSFTVGIEYSLDGYVVEPSQNVQVEKSINPDDSAILEMREGFLFDTTYYISLFLQDANGSWTPVNDSSCDTQKTPFYDHQIITFFDSGYTETSAFNGSVVFKKGESDDVGYNQDTVKYLRVEPSYLRGFVSVGPSFEMGEGVQTDTFSIGIRYDSIPDGLDENDIRVYRFTQERTLEVVYNSYLEDGFVWIRTEPRNMKAPFLLLIDTLQPRLTLTTGTEDAIDPGGDRWLEQFSISDNISNAGYTILAGEGGTDYTYKRDSILTDTLVDVTDTIPLEYANKLNGTRGLIIVNDDVNADTVDISRLVISDSWEVPASENREWIPLAARGVLEDSLIENVLDELKENENSEWKYDIYKFRLFRYVGKGVKHANEDGWLEYGDSVKQYFSLVPGRVFWLKTSEYDIIKLGSGKTMSLKDTFGIKLAPRQWTDFASPFQFDVPFSAVMDATPNIDSIQLHHWVKTRGDIGGVYTANEFYISVFDSLARAAAEDVLSSEVRKYAYTAYNLTNDTLILRIPPVAAKNETSKRIVTKKDLSCQWGIWFDWREAGQLSSRKIRCVVDETLDTPQRVYALPPSFGGLGAALVDTLNNALGGHIITANNDRDGYFWEIVLFNQGNEAKNIDYNLQNLSSVPDSFEVRIWDSETQSFEWPGGMEREILQPSARKTKWIVVGTQAYLSDFKQNYRVAQKTLLRCCFDPLGGRLSIRYKIGDDSFKQIAFSIYDLKGRLVWQNSLRHTQAGVHTLLWDGISNEGRKVSSGQYIVRMSAKSSDGTHKILGEQAVTFFTH